MLDFNIIADIEIIISLVLAVLFTAGYLYFFHWRKTSAGRALLYLFVSWIAVSLISFLAVWISPDYWLRPLWRALGWGFVVFSLLNLLRVLWKSFRKHENPIAYVEPRHTRETPIVNPKDSSRD